MISAHRRPGHPSIHLHAWNRNLEVKVFVVCGGEVGTTTRLSSLSTWRLSGSMPAAVRPVHPRNLGRRFARAEKPEPP